MNLLLDTHVLIWFLEDNPRLSQNARVAISNSANTSFVSVVSAWEIAIKVSIGKLKLPVSYEDIFSDRLGEWGFTLLPIRYEHLRQLIGLPLHHRDPFDRLLIAQAQSESMNLVTGDLHFSAYEGTLIL